MKIEYKPIKDIQVGDKLLSDTPTEVTHSYEEHIPEEMYSITFEDGTVVECSGNHLWYCETEDDENKKDVYRALLRGYADWIPKKLKKDEIFTKRELIHKIADGNIITGLLVNYLLNTLGPSFQSPNMTFDGYMDPTDLTMTYQYSYNDLINLWEKQTDENNYFYFGATRTTKEIAGYRGDINIPTIQDVRGSSF